MGRCGRPAQHLAGRAITIALKLELANDVPLPPIVSAMKHEHYKAQPVYWSPHANWSPDSPDAADFTFVAAKRLAWRDASQWMGESFRLGLGPPTDGA